MLCVDAMEIATVRMCDIGKVNVYTYKMHTNSNRIYGICDLHAYSNNRIVCVPKVFNVNRRKLYYYKGDWKQNSTNHK